MSCLSITCHYCYSLGLNQSETFYPLNNSIFNSSSHFHIHSVKKDYKLSRFFYETLISRSKSSYCPATKSFLKTIAWEIDIKRWKTEQPPPPVPNCWLPTAAMFNFWVILLGEVDSGNLQVLPVFVNKLRAPQIEKPPWDLISTLLYFLHLSNHLRKWFPLKLWDTEWKTHQDLMTVFQHTQHLLKESWLFQHLCNCANWKQIKKVEQEFVFFSYCHKPSIKVKLLIGRRGKEWRAMNEENWRIFF